MDTPEWLPTSDGQRLLHGRIQPLDSSPGSPQWLILTLVAGIATGGATDYPWFSLDGDWTWSRLAVHGTLGLMGFYIGLSWLGAAIGTSPHRSIGTVALAPLFVFLAHWAYGQGVNKAWREVRKTGGAAGVGRQIDDRERTL
jgi:hypothetical protein